ncbi:YheC/YheD family protein [Phosphitispora fastidiosa]|uniref:YheC/YheD family endospore coat-associated protein n=1 Tax=Phosphitispora fastidiosa TaxID=2837202 RepID=UPI001E447525|nr:YheC/YheD family protein [Phosphitispora fastidiosa]MBU7008812.1 hypothetical protein [Phosphitispora fastidiosa]
MRLLYIRWIPCQETGVMFLAPKTFQNFKIECRTITLHLGDWKKKLSIKLCDELDENIIGLPNDLTDALTIPETIPYDIKLIGEDIYLGPVIAFFVREGYLSSKRIERWKLYCQNYSQIRGLVYFCTVSGIDMRTKKIRGYYFEPYAKEKGRLKSGIFPFPAVIYRRARINGEVLKKLKIHVDNKIFNARIFNKLEMWEVLSAGGFVHTPYTTTLDGLYSLQMMLTYYNSVYLKPQIGRFGNGIIKIKTTPEGYLFKEKSGAEQWAKDLTQVFQLTQKFKKKGEYIIQQDVSLNFEEKPVDFRVILQKDGSKNWTCSGIIAKVGINRQIHTNNPFSIHLGREALQMIFGLSPEQASEKENEIIRICTEACLLLERAYGYFGDVGIDVVVDKNLKIWVLEINKSHQHDMASYLKEDDPDMFKRVVSRPLEYAKALAGF